MEYLSVIVNDRLHNKKFFTARLLLRLSQECGFHPDVIAEGLFALVAVILLVWKHANFLANAILIAYPLAITYVYTEERPPRDDLLIYWASFALLTSIDRILENILGYYIIKIALLVLLFVEPYRFVDYIRRVILAVKDGKSEPTPTYGNSPRPAKPESDEQAGVWAARIRRSTSLDGDGTPSAIALNAAPDYTSALSPYSPFVKSNRTMSSVTTPSDSSHWTPSARLRAQEVRLATMENPLTARLMSPSGSVRMGSTQEKASERQELSEVWTAPVAQLIKSENKYPAFQPPAKQTLSETNRVAPPRSKTPPLLPKKTPPLLSARSAKNTAIEKSSGRSSRSTNSCSAPSLLSEKSNSNVSLQEKKDAKPVIAVLPLQEKKVVESKPAESSPIATTPEVQKGSSPAALISPTTAAASISPEVQPSPVAVTPPVPPSGARASVSDPQVVKSEYASTPTYTARSSSMDMLLPPRRVASVTDIPSMPRFYGHNPMASDSSYRLRSSHSNSNEENKEIGPPPNLNDLVFYPMNKVVFNAPFDFENITYHMQLWNKSKHNIAFAVKGNCVPRVTVYPPYGIIASGQKLLIAITTKMFAFNDLDYNKDRVVFEYVLLKESQKHVTQFDHSLFQEADVKRRKNIYVHYNP